MKELKVEDKAFHAPRLGFRDFKAFHAPKLPGEQPGAAKVPPPPFQKEDPRSSLAQEHSFINS